MGRREDEVREEMARDADTARGLGLVLGTADMRYYADELAEAALYDDMRVPAEVLDFNRRLNEQMLAEADTTEEEA